MSPEPEACDGCLRRSWLLARLAGHLDRHRDRLESLLGLGEEELISALCGRRRAEIEHDRDGFDADQARVQAADAGVEQICRCHPAYPAAAAELEAPPTVLHLTGRRRLLDDLSAAPGVAIVGARHPSSYGLEVAHHLGRRLAAAGLTVISGMARGIDGGAHRGALDVDGATVAVLAGAPELAYPARARTLHARIRRAGLVISELPPGTRTWRWMFPARNRLIAALSAMTIVVEARAASGALITADCARQLGRPVGAVPGRITSPLARGPHQLLRSGARLIEGAEDVLDVLYGPDAPPPGEAASRLGPPLEPDQQAVLDALSEGTDPDTALRRAGVGVDRGLALLASLELAGRVSRDAGGRYSVRL